MEVVDAPTLSNSNSQDSAGCQSYRAAESGLDFDYAVLVAQSLGTKPGTGVTVAHFDEGWDLDHPAFSWRSENGSCIEFLGNHPIKRGRFVHGNSVLGLHLGVNPGRDSGDPLLPGARFLLVQSVDTEESTSKRLLAVAIERLKKTLPAVLLIARDWSSRAPHLPYELKPGIAELLAEAVSAGIVVVQSAGNAGINLGDLVSRSNDAIRDQFMVRDDSWIMVNDEVSPAFKTDSGTIVVGACTSGVPHTRWTAGFPRNPQPRSNFGSRVDCWAHGEHLSTASSSPEFTHHFGGTSGAAAIIAAGVAIVQSIELARSGHSSALSAWKIRELFRAPALGAPVVDNGSTIGSVPNLRKIIDHRGGR